MMDGQVSKAVSIRDTISNNSKLALGPVIVVNMITRDQIVTKKYGHDMLIHAYQ